MQLPNEKELGWYDRLGVARPLHQEHGTLDPKEFIPFKATKWWLEGDMLYAEGNHGTVANKIPPDFICEGTDEQGLPILRRIVL